MGAKLFNETMNKKKNKLKAESKLSGGPSTKPWPVINIGKASFITKLVMGLVTFEVLLVFLDVFVNYYGWAPTGGVRRMVNLTREDSLGTWFSSTQTLFVGITLFLIGVSHRYSWLAKAQATSARGWFVLAGFFTYMGIDDAIKFHERIGSLVKSLMQSPATIEAGVAKSEGLIAHFPSYTWQLVFGPFFACMGLFILFFLWRELKAPKLRLLFILGLSLFVLAVGMDFVEGLDKPYEILNAQFGWKTKTVRHMAKAAEEFFEMLGTTMFFWAFMEKLLSTKHWEIRISK